MADQNTEDETAKRRDEVIRRMILTPPQPKPPPVSRPKGDKSPK